MTDHSGLSNAALIDRLDEACHADEQVLRSSTSTVSRT
jgi:hypothetical protein